MATRKSNRRLKKIKIGKLMHIIPFPPRSTTDWIRLLCFAIVFCLVINILWLGGSGYGLVSRKNIREYANKRSVATETKEAKRGTIYTSDEQPIATNVTKYRLTLVLDTPVRDIEGSEKKYNYILDIEDCAKKLAPILDMEEKELLQIMNNGIKDNKWEVGLGSKGQNLSRDTKKKIEALEMTGLDIEEQSVRNYPLKNFASYVIGYATNTSDDGKDNNTKTNGKCGIEKAQNDVLAGEDGYVTYQEDSQGYVLANGILDEKDAVDGQDVYLTINSDLQRSLDKKLATALKEGEGEFAACAVMEAKTGKILAISQTPGYDPNERDIDDYTDVFLNYPYECGSVFKPFVYLSVMEDGDYPSDNTTYLSGAYRCVVGGKTVATIHDHNDVGWGYITYGEGLAHSSNVAICNLLAKYSNKTTVVSHLKELGFWQKKLSMDGLSVSSGTCGVDNSDDPVVYYTTGFGQGSTVTAYQLLQAYSVFANDGKTVKPYIVDKIVDPTTNKVTYTGSSQYSEQLFKSEYVEKVAGYLHDAVNKVGVGASTAYKSDKVDMIGKTGTAQISGGKSGYRTDVFMKSFCGLAPADDPEIEVFIFMRTGSGGAPRKMAKVVESMMQEAMSIQGAYTSTTKISLDENYTIDNYTNQSVNYVQSKLSSKNLNVEIIGNGNTVVDQYPEEGTSVSSNTKIYIKSDGDTILMPNMKGWSRKDVSTWASFTGADISFSGDSGTVTKQSLKAGKTVKNGKKITVTIK